MLQQIIKDVIADQNDEIYILKNITNNTLSIINQTAYIVWELCMHRTIDEIYTEVYQIFNNQIDINIIKKDVNMILEEFLKQSLIIEHEQEKSWLKYHIYC